LCRISADPLVISHGIYLAILAALVAERIFELWLSNRNAQVAFARGGVEFGRGQYRIMIAFHTAFIAACTIESMLHTTFPTALVMAAMAGEIAAQALRYWAVATLGEKWNTRVIVVPGSEPVTSGPYRYIRHPNYAAVVIETVCVPLIYGLMITIAVFSIGNAILLVLRIPTEEQALGKSYQRAFASLPRFIPRTR
jgi:methyltransferase